MRRTVLPTVLLLALLASLALPLASPAARPPVQPIPRDSPFEARYDVVGRVVDANGWPANQMTLEVELVGVDGVRVEPVRVATSCYGDFGAVFDLRNVTGETPRALVRVLGDQQLDGAPFPITTIEAEAPLDRYHRITQLTLRLADAWPSECGEARGHWEGRVTIWGRAVRGVPEHEANGTAGLLAQPLADRPVRAIERLSTGGSFRDDGLVATDARGDFKYSWTNALRVDAADVTVAIGSAVANATMDPIARVAFVTLHEGLAPQAPPRSPARADQALVAVVAIALVAIVAVVRKG